MVTNLNLIKKDRRTIEQLQNMQQINITVEVKKILSKYIELMKLKLSMYYTPADGAFKGTLILKDKYRNFDLGKIDQAINEARGKVNKTGYLDLYLDYVANKYLCTTTHLQ